MKGILGIGNALVDIVTFIEDESILTELSLQKGSMQLVDEVRSEKIKNATGHCRRIITSGGSAANTIHGLGMLNAETRFTGSVGRDETGLVFENELMKAGVRTFLKRTDTVTGTAVALVTPDGERTFGTHLGAAVEIGAGDLSDAVFSDCDILYLEGYLIYNMPLVLKACSLAAANNMKVALDLASFNVVKDNLANFITVVNDFADIVFANEQEAEAFTGQGPEKAAEALSGMCEIAVVKTGENGSLVRAGGRTYRIGALPVKCMDTTGAGDLYASGFLYGFAHGLDPGICGRYGSILAASVIEITGARIPEDSWPGIKKQLASV